MRWHTGTLCFQPELLFYMVLQVNSSYTPPNDKCVQYTCEKLNGQLGTKETKATCPPFNPLDCEPVSLLDFYRSDWWILHFTAEYFTQHEMSSSSRALKQQMPVGAAQPVSHQTK